MSEFLDIDADLELLLEAIYSKYHYDFRGYARASLRRRLRAAFLHFGCADVHGLKELILREPRAFSELLRYFTVQVSEMFRDPSYYRAVRERVVPYLKTYASLKLWVAGCSTGEEAYSFAILLAEEGLLDRTLIYATDINAESLRTAEQGIYAVSRFAHFSQNYLEAGGRASLSDYYTAHYSSAVLDRTLRKAILFSDHSLATDSAFAEVEFASCRNVLIYFERALQDRAISVLTDSVRRKGFLGIGLKETLRFSPHAVSFREFAHAERIYQRL